MREEGGTWRHELKFICSKGQEAMLRSRLRALLRPDPHTGEDGLYEIRSVYFDDAWDTCLGENEDGTDPREKFRIRIYNGSDEKITLELKQKLRGMTRKLSAPLTREQTDRILAGQVLPLAEIEAQELAEAEKALLRKFSLQQTNRLLRPKVIVEYTREPYIYQLGNVRITFDSAITSSVQTQEFLQGDFRRRPILETGMLVLEVKYDAFLPDAVRQILQLGVLQRTSFSKYYLCRRYTVGQTFDHFSIERNQEQ